MEELIKSVLKVDKKAREMTEKSRQRLEQSASAIEARIKQLEKQYEESAEEIIELTTEDESERIIAAKNEIDARFKSADEYLDKVYNENKEKWVEEIAKNAISD